MELFADQVEQKARAAAEVAGVPLAELLETITVEGVAEPVLGWYLSSDSFQGVDPDTGEYQPRYRDRDGWVPTLDGGAPAGPGGEAQQRGDGAGSRTRAGVEQGDVVIPDDGPVSGWLADERLADVREPGLRGRWDGLNPWGARDVGTRDYSPSPAQLTRLAVLGLFPVQVARSGGSVYEVLVRSAPEQIAQWLGFDGDLLAGDMGDVVVEVGSRLVEAFRAGNVAEWYGFLGSDGSEQREAGVARLERYLGTGDVSAVAEEPGGEGVVADGDVGGVLLGLVARFIGLGVEVIREDGAVHVLSPPAAGGELVRLVRVNHPKVHYLGTRSAGEALLGMSIDRLTDVASTVDMDPVWDDTRAPLRDLLSRLVGSGEAMRLRTQLLVLVESVRQWDQALKDAPYADDTDWLWSGPTMRWVGRRWLSLRSGGRMRPCGPSSIGTRTTMRPR